MLARGNGNWGYPGMQGAGMQAAHRAGTRLRPKRANILEERGEFAVWCSAHWFMRQPWQPLEIFHLLVFHWWIMNPQLSLHRGPCAVLLTGPGVAARDSLAAQASRWWHRASYFLSSILLLLPFSIAADNSSILSLRLITQSKDSSLLYIPTWLWTSFCSFLTLN